MADKEISMQVIGVVGDTLHITETHRADPEPDSVIAAVHAASSDKDDLVYDATNRLRQELRAISGMTDNISETNLLRKWGEMAPVVDVILDTIEDSLKRARRLRNSLRVLTGA